MCEKGDRVWGAVGVWVRKQHLHITLIFLLGCRELLWAGFTGNSPVESTVMCSTTVSKCLPYPEQNIPSNSLLNAQKSNISASHSPQCSDLTGKYQCLKFREREVPGCFPTLPQAAQHCLSWTGMYLMPRVCLWDLGISTGCHSEAVNALPGDSPWNYHFTCWSALWCDPETHLDRLGMIPGELFFN